MGFKLLDRAAKLLPKKFKRLYVQFADTNIQTTRNLLWDPDEVIEFWLDGFNDGGLDKAFIHIVNIYDLVLRKDPNWHYFYEGHYSLIRCSFRYQNIVRGYLDKHEIKYKWPISNWTESVYTTNKYQDIYKDIFHNISVLMIRMYKEEDGGWLLQAGDRVIHPFFNHGFYLAKMAGLLDPYETDIEAEYYEADYMGKLAITRAYHIGMRLGEDRVADHYAEYFDKIRNNDEEKVS